MAEPHTLTEGTDPEYMTLQDACVILGLGETSVVNRIYRKQLVGKRKPSGHGWLVNRASVEAYRAKQDAKLAKGPQ